MRYALDADGREVLPWTPADRARCPYCGAEVFPRLGDLLCDHWAHHADEACARSLEDRGAQWQPEQAGSWHRDWQRIIPGRAEVHGGRHRTDVQVTSGLCVEIQHGPIPDRDVRARIRHWGAVAWLFDARDAFRSGLLTVSGTFSPSRRRIGWTWTWPRRTVAAAHVGPIICDLDGQVVLEVETVDRTRSRLEHFRGDDGSLGARRVPTWEGRGLQLTAAECARRLGGHRFDLDPFADLRPGPIHHSDPWPELPLAWRFPQHALERSDALELSDELRARELSDERDALHHIAEWNRHADDTEG